MEHEMYYKRGVARKKAYEQYTERDGESPYSEWLTCPDCGSNKTAIVGKYEAIAACAQCGYNTALYVE